MNATVGSGRSVHAMRPAASGQLSHEHIKCGAGWTNAGGRMVSSKIRLTEHEVTCKRCQKIEAQAAPAAAPAAKAANAVTITYVVHSYEGNTFEAPMSAAEAEVRLAKLLADPEITDARIETHEVSLTAAQRSSLDLVAHGLVRYRAGRTNGARSGWTRYSYHALIGGKNASRTKSVDVLVDLGLADLEGSASYSCKVILTQAAKDFLAGPNAL